MPIVPPTDASIREHGLEVVGSKVPGGSSVCTENLSSGVVVVKSAED